MNIYNLLNEMDKLIDDAWSVPLTGGKSVVDAERARDILDDLRNSIPQEVRQARAITADRKQILADAKREGELIVNKAKERAELLINQDELVRQAHAHAKEIVDEAKKQADDIKKSTQIYVNNFMKNIDEQLSSFTTDFHKMRQNIKDSSIK